MIVPRWISLFLFLVLCTQSITSKVIGLKDANEYKKTLKSRTNVLVALAGTKKDISQDLMSKLEAASSQMSGQATVAYLECSVDRTTKQVCKKLGWESGVALKHFNKGEFNKDYDRPQEVRSIVNFLKDPTDLPWEEDPTATSVLHLDDGSFDRTLAQKKKTLVMFYAPWCGHCKKMKPEYSLAAQELESGKKKSPYILAAVDATKSAATAQKFNIEGYPTLKYFENGEHKYDVGQARTQQELVDWMKNPQAPAPPPPPEPTWADQPDVVHLNDDTFAAALAQHPSMLVMFYAPWCGHCKKAKPEYSEAATQLKEEGVNGVLAAVDSTLAPKISKEYGVKSYPTLVYYKNGKQEFNYGAGRDKAAFVEFMKDPKAPPPPPPPEPAWSDTKSNVQHLTDSNFSGFLRKNKKKHVLVMFYAPWCGHCKHMKPDYTEAAAELVAQKRGDLLLAAVDATKETKVAGDYEIHGYPSLKYFHNGEYQRDYEGQRDKNGILSWMQQQADGHSDL